MILTVFTFKKKFLLLFLLGIVGMQAKAQLVVSPLPGTAATATTLVNNLVGMGITFSGATLTCDNNASGTFTTTGTAGTALGIDSGIILTTGRAKTTGIQIGSDGDNSLFASVDNTTGGDADLTALSTVIMNDKCVLEFDFIPSGDTIRFNYKFGSEEYPEFTCGTVNDAFGFFLSGPGITGPYGSSATNLALIPGTDIPVTINTVNDAFCSGTLDDPFYIDNTFGPTSTIVAYDGTTVVLQAVSVVTPCSTYHLKLAIADGGDSSWDSGVFLEAGSLTSPTIETETVSAPGIEADTPSVVRGCNNGAFIFTRTGDLSVPLTVNYVITGTATNGVDYATIPDNIIIPAGSTTGTVIIDALHVPGSPDVETIELLILSPYTCGGEPVILDTAIMLVIDSLPPVKILTPDTTVCSGESIQIFTEEPEVDMTFSWAPGGTLSSTTDPNPVATATVTTTYVVTGSYPGTGCLATTDSITITMRQPAVVNAGPDLVTCLGTPVNLSAVVAPDTQDYTWEWLPAAGLSDPFIPNPVFTPTAVSDAGITFTVTANPGSIGCADTDTVVIRVLPDEITLFNSDTTICQGASVSINANGHPEFTYIWTPSTGVSNPNILEPVITPAATTTYVVSAAYPTCPTITRTLSITVEPVPFVSLGEDRFKCEFDTLQLVPQYGPESFTDYTFTWTPDTNLVPGLIVPDVIFNGTENDTIIFTVATPAGCSASDTINITVYDGDFASILQGDTGVCPRDSIMLNATGGIFYQWVPSTYLSDASLPDVVVKPQESISYTLYVTDINGCFDTLDIDITVHPDAVLSVPDSVILWPGDAYTINPEGNGYYFNWFPPLGLSNTEIANPVMTPEVNTRYYVVTRTEYGCSANDSVDVIVNPESAIDVPNAFVPGTGVNNQIKVVHSGIAKLGYFRIFNRWGEKVFETSNLDEGWNGRLNDTPQPMGVYIYQVEAFTNLGRRVYKQGNITLIR